MVLKYYLHREYNTLLPFLQLFNESFIQTLRPDKLPLKFDEFQIVKGDEFTFALGIHSQKYRERQYAALDIRCPEVADKMVPLTLRCRSEALHRHCHRRQFEFPADMVEAGGHRAATALFAGFAFAPDGEPVPGVGFYSDLSPGGETGTSLTVADDGGIFTGMFFRC